MTTTVQSSKKDTWVFPGQASAETWEFEPLTSVQEQVESFTSTTEFTADEKALSTLHIYAADDLSRFWFEARSTLVMVTWAVRNLIHQNAKRTFDLVFALMVLPFIFPILVVTAIAVRLESEGPIIFRQKRIGKWGKTFTCYKFRSMYKDAEVRKAALMHMNEADKVVFKIKNDPRITRVGRFIRKASIDELPQIFNVIKGDMSLVGPRPPVPGEVANYKYDQLRRLDATPGITGLQQVKGRSTLDFKTWVELDVQYIRDYSLFSDIKILIMTIPAVISARGAY